MALIIAMAIVMILAANTLFLGSYYVRKNRSLFIQEYGLVKNQFDKPDGEVLELLRERDQQTGFLYYVIGQDLNRILIASVPDFFPVEGKMSEEEGRPRIELPREQLEFIGDNRVLLQNEEILFGQVLREDRVKAEFDLLFAAKLDTRHLLIIVRPVEQLDEHTAIANQFMLIIGILALFVSIAIARIVAQSVVQPIKEITQMGEHIADLDFSRRYRGCARDEIGILGNSINRISTQLDGALREREETNRQLQTELNLQKRFFAGVSHEFKTPVGLIRGYAESLNLGLAGTAEEIGEFSRIIMDETDRLSHLVSDIMFLVKSESAEFTLNRKRMDLVGLINSILEKNRPVLREKGIVLERNLAGKAVILGDEIRIGQIFENLLSNALRYTSEGYRIIIRSLSDDSGVTIYVENEGEPIPDEHIRHLSEPFYSTYESRDKSSSGTGLGLSIVKNLVEKHDGQWGIDNMKDNDFSGVRAWFWLPVPSPPPHGETAGEG